MADPSSPIREEVRAIAPYNAGLTIDEVRRRHGVEVVAKLGSNENPNGPSAGIASVLSAIHELARLYPDPSGRALAAEIAGRFGVEEGQVVLGNGSEDLIAVICRAVVRPGDAVATLYPSFPLHEDYTTLMGGRVDRIAVRPDLTIDVDALVTAARRKPRMLLFANPMNPVGSWLTPAELDRVIAAVDKDTLVVVDEAYAEYAAGEDYPSAVDLLRDTPLNWAMLRTFSKAYGLAGLRIGYGIASSAELCGFFDRARTPFNTNAIAQAAALAALADPAHLDLSVAMALSERDRIGKVLLDLGYRIAPSKCNFLFFDAGRDATVLAEALLARGVIVKPWKQPGFETFVRVSIGSPIENDHFLAALKAVGPA
ncbi:histidinol-phosphate transaminase [Rhizobium sp. TRM96647]|uniref:histidinol-phosphate transaminase n=1 Tax=unclassified Rhizobium TaxID=2613769 RepID=UPI0021E7FD8B|nr:MULTISPECIES: histidinol-phosphate transaminase [unclassified Rhizobium]MCV3738774.1 histidinol-phosphate transaminase [Rhizobium sp. TRM96647]MCV3760519.1 histidinol-phosphate transaminase [Rhizobium sp. TRM96650]